MKKKLWMVVVIAMLLTACQSGETQNTEIPNTEGLTSEMPDTESEAGTLAGEDSEADSTTGGFVTDNSAADTSTEDEEKEYENSISNLSEEERSLYKDVVENRIPKDEYVPNGVTPQEIIDIIHGTGTFLNTDDENRSITLSELKRVEEDKYFEPDAYLIVDLDMDGYNELIVYGLPESTEIFHYEAGTVYGYEFNFRGTALITSNGVLHSSHGAASGEYYRLDFDKDKYTETSLICYDGMPMYEEYKVLGVAVSEMPIHVFELGIVWSYDKEGILAVIEREEAYVQAAEKYIKSKSVAPAIIEAVSKQEEKIEKYTIADIDGDGTNEVITYHGTLIPLATIYYEYEGKVMSYTMLESKIWFINSDGICYQLGADGEQISCRYEFLYSSVQTKELNKLDTVVVDNAGKLACKQNGEPVSLAEYLEYHKQLWEEKLPFCRDLSLLK